MITKEKDEFIQKLINICTYYEMNKGIDFFIFDMCKFIDNGKLKEIVDQLIKKNNIDYDNIDWPE